MELGYALAAQRKLDEAIACYRQAIRLENNFALAHSNLGAALYRKGKLDEAIAAFREAIRLKNDYPEAHYNLGNALRARGKLDEAIAEYRQAIRLEKDYPEAHNNLAIALTDKGKLDEAIACYRQAIRLKNDFPEAHNNLGAALERKGKLDEAIAAFRQAIRLKNDYAEAHNNLGVDLARKGEVDEAIAAFRQAIRLEKDHALAHNNLGNALSAQGKLDEGIAAYRQAIRHKKDYAEAHCNLGRALFRQGRFADALAALKRGHRLGSLRPGWPHPSAGWVRQAEQMVRLEGRLGRVLEGKDRPRDAGEFLGFASLCQRHHQGYAAAARFYAEAFTRQPARAADLEAQHRYNAACAAALAGCGQGKDAALDPQERARLRQQALTWLRADLKAYRRLLEEAANRAGPTIAQRLEHWLEDGDFAGVRAAGSLERLPQAERHDWQQLWKEVETLRQRAAHRPTKAGSALP
jgi:Flp pilus assembly protein TadD